MEILADSDHDSGGGRDRYRIQSNISVFVTLQEHGFRMGMDLGCLPCLLQRLISFFSAHCASRSGLIFIFMFAAFDMKWFVLDF